MLGLQFINPGVQIGVPQCAKRREQVHVLIFMVQGGGHVKVPQDGLGCFLSLIVRTPVGKVGTQAHRQGGKSANFVVAGLQQFDRIVDAGGDGLKLGAHVALIARLRHIWMSTMNYSFRSIGKMGRLP